MRFATGVALLWAAFLTAIPAAALLVIGVYFSVSIFQVPGLVESGCLVGAASVALAWVGAFMVSK